MLFLFLFLFIQTEPHARQKNDMIIIVHLIKVNFNIKKKNKPYNKTDMNKEIVFRSCDFDCVPRETRDF